MSGAVAAHAAYNGSGTQGLAVTNKIQGNDGDVMSVFWNKNDTTRQLLYGSAFVEIPSSGASSTELTGSSRLFTVNNDIDCLGDLYLQYNVTSVAAITGGNPSFVLLGAIDRIEIQVGTQIWQTIEKNDIKAVLSTELTESAFDSFARSTGASSGNVYLTLPSLFKTIGPQLSNFSNQTEDGYLMAAAPNQSVKIKVTFAAATSLTSGTGITTINTCRLYGKHQIMCNDEREQIKAMPMGLPKRLHMTQNVTVSGLASSTVTVDLDQFSLYASHLIITGDCSAIAGPNVFLLSAELKLNSSSFSGVLPGVLLSSATAESIGLHSNGNLVDSGTNFTNTPGGIGTYVFPLACGAYSGSSVPLNRFDSIRLTLTFTGVPTTPYSGSAFVSITCVGETTALFKGGAASLAMY